MAPRGPRRVRLRPRRWPDLGIDLHSEILLRLPPDQPKLLFRFAAVSRAWRHVITNADFRRRYREYHRVPPMIGCVYNHRFGTFIAAGYVSMIPKFPTPLVPRLPDNGRGLVALDSRHGRVLFRRLRLRRSLVLWDPLAAHHEDVRLPAEFPNGNTNWSAGILCDAVQPCQHVNCHAGPYRVIFIGVTQALASAYVYSSATTVWTATASVPQPAAAAASRMKDMATTVINDSMHFRTDGRAIIRYHFVGDAHRLSYIEAPSEIKGNPVSVLVPAAGGRLGFAWLSEIGLSISWIRIWETEVGAEGAAAAWEQQPPLTVPLQGWRLLGSVESPRSLLVGTRTGRGPISLNLETGNIKTLPKPKGTFILIPFMGFYTPGGV